MALLVVLYCGGGGATDVYRWQDADGNVIYSDTPQAGAEKVEIREPTVISGDRPRSVAEPAPAGPAMARPYDAVIVQSPANDETVRNNTGDVSVAVSVAPGLQTEFGHRIELLIDGKSVAPPGTNTDFTLHGVERGTHTLQARVFDDSGAKLQQSDVSTFFLHRHSVLHKQPGKQNPSKPAK